MKTESPDWVRQVDEELYFLSQDGYGYEWREQKVEDIRIILRGVIAQAVERLNTLGGELQSLGVGDDVSDALEKARQEIAALKGES